MVPLLKQSRERPRLGCRVQASAELSSGIGAAKAKEETAQGQV